MARKLRDRQKERRRTAGAALRKAGYVPIPRWWVLPDELDVIYRMAHNHEKHVSEIRCRALGIRKGDDDAHYD